MIRKLKKSNKRIRNSLLLILLLGISFSLLSCSSVPDLPYYQKSQTAPSFAYKSNTPFAEYIKSTRAYLQKNRVFFDASKRKEELEMVAPFEMKLPANCPTETKRGVLMVHGLSDTAYVMKDLAKKLNEQCILVRSILLPGHGTRPKDLADVTYQDWIKAVNYGINSLKQDVDKVYIAGFSLGGLLSANALFEHDDIQGAILIAPALGINMPMLTWNTTWLRYFKVWLDVDPNTQAARYQSMPTNGIAQTYLLADRFNKKLKKQKKMSTPILLIQSMEDIAIQPELNVNLFKRYMNQTKSKALIYAGKTTSVKHFNNLERVNSYLPDKKIINFSHISLLYSPENKVYGSNGSYKECGTNIGVIPAKQAEDCLKSNNNWKGEFNRENDAKYYPFQRLTFNPLFDSMVEQIDSYLKSL